MKNNNENFQNQFNKDFLKFGIIGFICYVLSYLMLEDGITKNFFLRMFPILLVIFVCILLLFFLVRKKKWYLKSIQNLSFNFSKSDFTFYLIPLSIIFHFYLTNFFNSEISLNILFNELSIILAAFLVSYIFVNLLPKKYNFQPLIFLNIFLIICIIAVIPLLSEVFSWHQKGSLKIFLGFFLLFYFLILFSFFYLKKILRFFSVLFFVSLIFSDIFFNLVSEKKVFFDNTKIEQFLKSKDFKNSPNIYLLTYDGYPQAETLKNYGIENKMQLIFLKERDFTYYPGTYTISTQSVFSMGRMLNLKLGNEHKAVAGESTVVKTLQKSGYKTYGIFKNRYFFKSIEKPEEFYDEIFPKTKSTGVLKAILEGEFRWDIDHEAELSEKYLSFKRKVLSEKSKKKRFIYTHTGPYHSIHNGKCDSKKEIKKFDERLKKSNEEMKQDVNQILKSDPNSIIVIHGDHGPFLLNKCGIIKDKTQINKVNRNFLQDNFSTFLAIKWPKGYTNKYKDTNIRTTQDTFFEVFEYLLDNEISNDFRLSPITDKKNTDGFIGAGVQINDGVIIGGPDHKKKLFKLD